MQLAGSAPRPPGVSRGGGRGALAGRLRSPESLARQILAARGRLGVGVLVLQRAGRRRRPWTTSPGVPREARCTGAGCGAAKWRRVALEEAGPAGERAPGRGLGLLPPAGTYSRRPRSCRLGLDRLLGQLGGPEQVPTPVWASCREGEGTGVRKACAEERPGERARGRH